MEQNYIIYSSAGSPTPDVATAPDIDNGGGPGANSRAAESDPALARLAARAISVSEALRLRIDWAALASAVPHVPGSQSPKLPITARPVPQPAPAADLTTPEAALSADQPTGPTQPMQRSLRDKLAALLRRRPGFGLGATLRRTLASLAAPVGVAACRIARRIYAAVLRVRSAADALSMGMARAVVATCRQIDVRAEWRAMSAVVLAVGTIGYYFAAEHGRFERELRSATATLDRAALRRHFFSDTAGAFAPEPPAALPPNDGEIVEPPPKDYALTVPALDPAVALWLATLEHEVQPARFQRIVRTLRGESFFVMLMRAGVPGAEAQPAALELARVANANKLRQGQIVTLDFGLIGETHQRLMGARFDPSYDRTVTLRRLPQGHFRAGEIKKEIVIEVMRANGTIDQSVFQAGLRSGLPPEPVVRMINLFAFDIDFQRDLQSGDNFEVLLEIHRDDKGDILRYGEILYAAMTVRGAPVKLYRWHNDEDAIEYYNERGENVKKTLMRSPIDGARLSSGFGLRKHPILGFTRLHQGIDFAAPTGTPIFASGHGTIEKSGWRGGLGNAVTIRHGKEYSTVYGHMNSIAPGMEPGQRVRQGDVIGYVGSTGLSTGPHLHYEVHVNDKAVDPLSLKLQSSERLLDEELERFLARVRSIEGAYRALAKSGASSGSLGAAGN